MGLDKSLDGNHFQFLFCLESTRRRRFFRDSRKVSKKKKKKRKLFAKEMSTFRWHFGQVSEGIYSISVCDVLGSRVRLLYLMLRHVHVVPGYIARTFIDEHRRSQARSRGIARDRRTSYRGNIGLRWDARDAPGFLFVHFRPHKMHLHNSRQHIVSDISSTVIQSNKFLCVSLKNC